MSKARKKPRKQVKSQTRPLTGKQQAFVAEYCNNGFNALRACLTAGYSQSYAYHKSSQLVVKSSIKSAIEHRQKQMGASWDIDWWRENTETALNDAQTSKSAIAQARVLEMAGKHIGAFEKDNAQKETSFKDIIAGLAAKRAKQVESREVQLIEAGETPQQAGEGPNGG